MPRAWLAVFQIVYFTWYRSHYWRPVIHIWSLFRGGQGNHWQGVGCLLAFAVCRDLDVPLHRGKVLWLLFGEHVHEVDMGTLETRRFFGIGSSILALTGTWGGGIFHSFQCMCCSWWVAASWEPYTYAQVGCWNKEWVGPRSTYYIT